jgi:hypothetical protein
MKRFLITVALVGCGSKANTFPGGSGSDDTAAPSNTDADGAPPPGGCGDVWTEDTDGVATDPETCKRWSPPSADTMDWYTAASTSDGEAGGCGSDCPDPDTSHCDAISGLAGLDWRLPSKSELMAAAKTDPDITELDGRLWSRDTAATPSTSAWTVDLSRAGSSMSLDKSDTGIGVRCISDG